MMMHSPLIHFWAPGLFDFKGGIQVYSQFLLQALQEVYPQARYEVFLMHDRQPVVLTTPNVRFHCFGHLPSRLRKVIYAASLIQTGWHQRPDLVLTTHLNFTRAAAQLKRLTGTPYWTVAHGFEAWNVQQPSLRKALTGADRILGVSSYTCDRLLQEQNLAIHQVDRLPNTFEADRFRIAPKPAHLLQRHGLQPNQPVILTVNRLAAGEPFHSYDQILAALPQIRQMLPEVHYLIVGKGDDRPRLERLIAERQLQDCVTLAGFISDTELPDYYNLCDLFAMPSTLEGFGIVYLEALASGKPVLGGLDGAIDALEQGRLGALVDPHDIPAISQTLTQILQGTYPNPLLYQPMALRKAAIQSFGKAAFRQTLAGLLATSSLGRKAAPQPKALVSSNLVQFTSESL
ncbi:glycosyltransferase [Leptolyngbya sp. 'hensonii']|uniref:glycosyltransferase n=1 Tax=Leptolyngbya sp. 'hensonii' TaxID=1922337 RepID=UPI00094F84E5|nr:glycosyltransferase [Leptolyngbya sp. 'hensonii']OLP18912.1 glycosyltransferase [Leptolyngbya sp. 'hensonii']